MMAPICIGLLVVAAAALAPANALAYNNNGGGKKNVLYILADDMRADWGMYGLPVHTPNLDKLATESLRFQHAFCQISVCSPSRQSFMTCVCAVCRRCHRCRC